jgi:protocatechuate 3,4-dioxygenase beta subunit
VAIIRGTVTDPLGHPVAGAAVYVVSSPVRMPDIAQLTDDEGRFVLSAPVPGPYRLGIRSDSHGVLELDANVTGDRPIDVDAKFD